MTFRNNNVPTASLSMTTMFKLKLWDQVLHHFKLIRKVKNFFEIFSYETYAIGNKRSHGNREVFKFIAQTLLHELMTYKIV